MKHSSSSAFTLIELLVVVVIIAILAAIAVTNFLNARIRANIARVEGDFQAVFTALEAYRIDSEVYPPDFRAFERGWQPRPPAGTSIWDIVYQFHVLTTPIAYISTVPHIDPFRYDPRNDRFQNDPDVKIGLKYNQQYLYINDGAHPYWEGKSKSRHEMQEFIGTGETEKLLYLWKVNSVGPDGIDAYKDWANSPNPQESFFVKRYDPSNGLVSHGDIWKFGP